MTSLFLGFSALVESETLFLIISAMIEVKEECMAGGHCEY
jgi:hypothetical protein